MANLAEARRTEGGAMAIVDMVITPEEMAVIDRAAIGSGIAGFGLMRAAGEAVAAVVLARFPSIERAAVLCGPGNNGGDGYIAARALRDSGVPVAVFALGDPTALGGDAAKAYDESGFEPRPLEDYEPQAGDVVVDGLFGAGLARPVEGVAAECIARVNDGGVRVVSIDLPSGVGGLSGKVMGTAIQADETVTFFARKPGHLLMPGRQLAGRVTVTDIGIPRRFAEPAGGQIRENGPAVWEDHYPRPETAGHKYTRGHLVILSGPASATGAARLAAAGGARAGAGLVTVAARDEAVTINAGHLTAIMVRRVDNAQALRDWVEDKRLSTFVLGPGFGVGERVRAYALALKKRQLVLDADGITSFSDCRDMLFQAFAGDPTRLVLTPHDGEFGRLFPDIDLAESSKVEAARKAAAMANAVVVIKGPDTVVAAPDGRAFINGNAPAWLATAGAGDVLAGIVGGLLAQGMPPFEAAAAGVWIHGAAASIAGPGMTADDLPAAVARVRVS